MSRGGKAVRIALPVLAVAGLIVAWVLSLSVSAPEATFALHETRTQPPLQPAVSVAPRTPGVPPPPVRSDEGDAGAVNPARGLIEVRMRPPGLPAGGTFVPSEPSEWIARPAGARRAPGAGQVGPKIPAPPLPEE